MNEPGPGAAELRSVVDRWFEDHGVPRFNREYSSRTRVPTLMVLLGTVLAFEVGLGPWIQLDATQLLLAPGILVLLALWVRPALMAILGLGPRTDHGWWSFPIRATGFGLAAAYLLTRSEMPPGPWSDAWVDFGVALGGLLTFVVLFNDAVWQGGSAAQLARRRRRLVGLITGAVLVFACEGSVIAPFYVPLDALATSVDPGLRPVPQALPALVVVWIIFFYALRLARAACPGDAPAQRAPEPHAEAASGLDMAIVVPAVPLAMLVFSGETAVLPHALAEGWGQAVPPLLLLLVLAWLSWRQRRLWQAPSGLTDTDQAKRWISQRLRYPILLYLLAYPTLVVVFFGVDAFGRHLTGLPAFALTFGIQALYVAVGWFIVGFGLDRVAVWAGGGARRNLRSVVTALARGLPLLLLFSGVLVFTAEIWEVAVEMPTGAFIGLVALLLALTASLMLITSVQELTEHCHFATRSDVCASASGAGSGPGAELPPPEPFATELEEFARNTPEEPHTLKLRGSQKVNALAVLSLYQALVFLPVLIASAGLLLAIGHIAVPVDVAAEWIYGDGPHPVRAPLLAERRFVDEPWTRVAVLLAIFSLLYLAASVLSDHARRAEFFEGADSAIRQRLAVALVYGRVVHGDDTRTAEAPIRRRAPRRSARPAAAGP